MTTQGRRRAYGQHFLRDKALCDRIATSALELCRENGCQRLLEVGPGKGAITLPILEHWPELSGGMTELVLVEKDQKLAADWTAEREQRLATIGKCPLRVESSDFLELPEERWLLPAPLGIVSNLPYSAGTAILDRLARSAESIPFMLLMFQAEVAQRIRAEPDTKAWGSLSVWIQNAWDVTRFATVPPGAFSPPPEVMSEVVVLRRRKEPRIPGTTRNKVAAELWEKLLKTAFAHRRKMLRSGLPRTGPWLEALEAAGIAGTRRAETLDWPDWEKLFSALSARHA